MSELLTVMVGCIAMAVAGAVLAVVLPGRAWLVGQRDEPVAADAEEEAKVAERVRARLALIQTTERRSQTLPFVGQDRRLAAEVIVRVPQRRVA